MSRADAFGSVNQDRRAALWQALAQERKPQDQPLFDCLDAEDDDADLLPLMDEKQEVIEDYRSFGLSLRAHPVSFYREHLTELKITPTEDLGLRENNRQVRVAGLVILRQRPATAKGITFVTLEDETGTANLVVRPQIWERHYKICRGSGAWVAHGKLEKKNGVIHVVVNKLEDMSSRLSVPAIKSRDFR